MDRRRFDDFARAFAASTPRRSLIGLIAGMAWAARADAKPARRSGTGRGTEPPHCQDGAARAGETDIDCGGTCAPCPAGAACRRDSDCRSGHCCSGHCTDCKPGEECNLLDGDDLDRCCRRDSPCFTCARADGAAWAVDNCGHRVNCTAEFLACPQPPDASRRNVNTCCADDRCACDGGCCGKDDECFIAVDGSGREVGEFCCEGQGGVICGSQHCCDACDDSGSGCLQSEGRLGSYRR